MYRDGSMMSNLSIVEATLPPGFRFHPRDDELICDYLSNKVSLSDSSLLPQVDLNKSEPWDLPETACVGGKEWYFYSQRDRKYATGLRTNRATLSGYWKATGKDRSVLRKRSLVGMRKTLVFYLGRAPKGKKTDWVMHEFRLQGPLAPPIDSTVKEDWVLCRVFCKNREAVIGGKQMSSNMNVGKINSHGGHDQETASCSSSLPPLTDPYTLSFDQTTQPTNTFNEQVPCFSIFTSISNPQYDLIHNDPRLFPNTITKLGTANAMLPPKLEPISAMYDRPGNLIPASSSHWCEKKEVIKAILSRFDKMDEQGDMKEAILSFGEGISDESFLSDAALLGTMWHP